MKTLTKKVLFLLKKRKFDISFAESCTGGLLSSKFTELSGSSKVFKLGLVTYSNKSKVNILKVPNKTIQKYGAVSVHTCKSMVINLNKLSGTKISLSITGVAGPKGGTQKKPVGLVYIGIVKGNFIKVKKFLFKTKSRKSIQNLTVKAALNLILLVAK